MGKTIEEFLDEVSERLERGNKVTLIFQSILSRFSS